MSEENNQTAVETQNNPAEVGKSTPARTLKNMWHTLHFKRVSIKNRDGAHVRFERVANHGAPSLKEFARSLAGNQAAKDWLDNKSGVNNDKRSDKNIADAKSAFTASKAARRKNKK